MAPPLPSSEANWIVLVLVVAAGETAEILNIQCLLPSCGNLEPVPNVKYNAPLQ